MKHAPLAALTLAAWMAIPATAATAAATAAIAPDQPPTPCRLPAVELDARCGSVSRPLDPARPDGPRIAVHYAVLPALARNRNPDPVFFFAGGPGQSAIALAGPMSQLMARLNKRRDVVLIDQRGTGRSAVLNCEQPGAAQPLVQLLDEDSSRQRLQRCREQLARLPHGDLRQYTTTIAIADADAVRQVLGAPQLNLVGGSYGTRAVLEYMRQFPQQVRRAVIDGVAPPDMVLPATIAPDAEAAFAALDQACAAEPACTSRYPDLRTHWRGLLQTLPREIEVEHPVTGERQRLRLTADTAAHLLRAPLYAPALASALPLAITEAAAGRFEALFGLGTALGGGRKELRLAEGMHFSVVCAEDYPRLAAAPASASSDFGDPARLYREVCANWPRAAVPAAFYTLPPAPAATLVLSGGLDPVTPPRHGEHVARALGARARHLVVPNAGHGVLAIGCARDLLYRFIDAGSESEALALDAGCVQSIPRPPAFQPVRAAAGGQP
jgi:pimeloyl-ACP methyl ester carboxylesterase